MKCHAYTCTAFIEAGEQHNQYFACGLTAYVNAQILTLDGACYFISVFVKT